METQKIGTKRKKSTKPSTGFKKAPQAPKRFKSPYILFSISKMQKYKVLYKNAKVTSFSSLISKEWKALAEEEKKKWKMSAEQDKLRYNTEKSLYKGPWQVPSERSRKDPSAPKRPPSAFLNYSRTRRTALIEENPHVKNTDISKLLGKEWKAVPQEVRQPHIDNEAREREAYHKKISAWRKKKLEAKETIKCTQPKPSPTDDQKILPQVLHTTLLQPPPPLQAIWPPVLLPPISAPPVEISVSMQRSESKNSGWGSFSSIEGSIPNGGITAIDHSLTNEGISSHSTLLGKHVLGHNNNGQLSTECSSHASAVQKSPFIAILPSPPMILLQPTPISGHILARQWATNSNLPNPFAANLCSERFVEKGKLSELRFPSLKSMSTASSAAAPVTPVQQPRRTATSDYQNLFFPAIFEEGDAANNNIVQPEDLDLLLTE